MASFTDLTGLAGIALALAAACRVLLWRTSLEGRAAVAVAGLVFVLLLLPFGELPLAAYVRGMTGDLSITTLVLIACVVVWRTVLPKQSVGRPTGELLLLVAVAAGVLYPLALGAASYDSYRWGYGEPLFLGVLLMIALASAALRVPLVTLSISLAVLAWSVGWYESGNLWDYLIDPLLAVYSVFALLLMNFAYGHVKPSAGGK
jgi:hypothetical protein